jgi:hypothetical protein
LHPNYERLLAKYSMYNSNFYSDQINLNKNLLKSDKKTLARQGEKNLLELKGRLLFELRTAQSQIKEILNNPDYEG